MKTSSKLLVLGLAFGLVSTTAHAQELIHVVLNLNLAVQADSVNDGTTTKTPPPVKFHLGIKELLSRIATDHGTNYPATAGIAYTNGFVVVDNTGAVLDSIPELTIDTGENNKVSSGSKNDANNAGTRKSLSIATLSFDDSGDSANQSTPLIFTAQGIFSSIRTLGTPDANNDQIELDTATASFAGEGTLGGKNTIVSGTLAGHGKGLLTP